jgi:hypothetical protein
MTSSISFSIGTSHRPSNQSTGSDLIAFTPAEVKAEVEKLWPGVTALVNKDLVLNGGQSSNVVLKFGSPRETPYFEKQPHVLAYASKSKDSNTAELNFNIGHQQFVKETNETLIRHMLVHEYLHAISDKFSKSLLDMVAKRVDINNPAEVVNANKFLDAVTEGVTDVLTEQILGSPSPVRDYTEVRKLGNALVRDMGLQEVKKAFYTGDPQAMATLFEMASRRVSFADKENKK